MSEHNKPAHSSHCLLTPINKATRSSGLGLEAQRIQVINSVGSQKLLMLNFVEVKSGKQNARSQLVQALIQAKQHKARLAIAKLDRLSRNAAFIFALKDSGVDFVYADMPHADTLTLYFGAARTRVDRGAH